MKVIVFDLDETLGYFGQLGDFINNLEDFIKKTISRKTLYTLLDIFPRVFRKDILPLIFFIKKLKKEKKIQKIIIYTNNEAPRSWVLGIKQYIENQFNEPLFDRIISAYKVNGIQIEKKRTTYGKTYTDLLHAANLTPNYKALFFDDQEHPIMNHRNVDYVKVRPYIYIYSNMTSIFLKSKLATMVRNKSAFIQFMRQNFQHSGNRHNPVKETRRLHSRIVNFAHP